MGVVGMWLELGVQEQHLGDGQWPAEPWQHEAIYSISGTGWQLMDMPFSVY